MKKLTAFILLIVFFVAAAALPAVYQDIPLVPGSYPHPGYVIYTDHSAQVLHAMGTGLGHALDAAQASERKKIIDSWLDMSQWAKKNASEAQKNQFRLQQQMQDLNRQNVRTINQLHSEITEMKEQNRLLKEKIKLLQSRNDKLKEQIEKLSSEKK